MSKQDDYRRQEEERRPSEESRYLSTLTDTGRSRYRAIRSHQFADSIGGCSSNYRF
jgi:hypothetical protein